MSAILFFAMLMYGEIVDSFFGRTAGVGPERSISENCELVDGSVIVTARVVCCFSDFGLVGFA